MLTNITCVLKVDAFERNFIQMDLFAEEERLIRPWTPWTSAPGGEGFMPLAASERKHRCCLPQGGLSKLLEQGTWQWLR